MILKGSTCRAISGKDSSDICRYYERVDGEEGGMSLLEGRCRKEQARRNCRQMVGMCVY